MSSTLVYENKKMKMRIKICVDIAITIALLLLMAYQLVGEEAHEWIDIAMFLLFVLHHVLNRLWSKQIFKGKYSVRRIFQTVLVLFILLCMVGSMVSGIIISRYVFVPLQISGDTETARSVHMLCAYWGFVFMSLHLGFHWNMIIAMAGKAFPKVPAGGRSVLRVRSVLIAGYGVIAFVQRDIWNYLILKNHFAFYDFSEPMAFFWLDYLAVMGMFVFVGYRVSKRKIIVNI